MSGLEDILADLISKNGPVSVASFMELALSHSEHGYYRQHDPLGRAGDFITAPEISQMFGEMIGLWCADVWRQMGEPKEFVLLELGPGRGTLMQDALRATGKLKDFQAALHLMLLESNETLRRLQSEKLGQRDIMFIDTLSDETLPHLPMIFIANEFFDALPVRQFEKTFQGWCERLVGLDKGKLAFTPWPLNPMLAQLIPASLQEANPGTVYEISMPGLTVMRTLAKYIKKLGGAGLIIDYGFAEAAGHSTLQALSHHEMVDVLTRPGEVDITAHVDFGALRHAASGQDLLVVGPIGQGAFLKSLGIELRAGQLKCHASDEQQKEIDTALERLISDQEMGVLFKAMAVASPHLMALPGF